MSPRRPQARLALVDAKGKVYAEQSTVWSPEHSKREDKIRIDIPEEARLAHAEGAELALEVQLGDDQARPLRPRAGTRLPANPSHRPPYGAVPAGVRLPAASRMIYSRRHDKVGRHG